MPIGKQQVVMSGQATADTYTWGGRVHTLGYAETVLGFEMLNGTSGTRWTVRGFMQPGTTPYSIASGTLTSGSFTRIHSGLYLNESVQPGVASECSEGSGTVTVYALQRAQVV